MESGVDEADFTHVRDWIAGLIEDIKLEPSEEDPELSDLPDYVVRRATIGMTKAIEVFYQYDFRTEKIHLLAVGGYLAGDH